MPQKKLPAVFMRGGTSKAVVFHARDLPAARAEWEPIFLSVIGSPDPSMRQLNGMGGGVSSLSKVCVIGPPTHARCRRRLHLRAGADRQGARRLQQQLREHVLGHRPLRGGRGAGGASRAAARRSCASTTPTPKKIIVSRFGMDGDEAAVAGDMALDGVAGTGAPIRLEFMEPGGAKTGKLLPTGKAADMLEVPGVGRVPREHGRCRQSVRVRAGRGDRRDRHRAADRDRGRMRS